MTNNNTNTKNTNTKNTNTKNTNTKNTNTKNTNTKGNNNSSRFVDSISILKIVFLLLLLVMVFRSLSGVNSITFTNFLEWLRDFHPTFTNLNFIDLTIVGDWGIFNLIKNFINTFTGAFSVLVFICKAIINFISYVTGFVRFLFLF